MAFANSILAGTKLVREAIQSPNFETNVAGWSVNKDGTAEFSEVVVRGTVAAADPSDPVNRYAYMADGIVGVVDLNGPWISQLTETLLGFAGPNKTMYFTFSDGSGAHWRVGGQYGVMISASDTRGFLRWNEDSINTNAEEWTDAALANGWTNTGGAYANVGYYMGPDGFVHLRGAASAGTDTGGTRLFTLPVNYRPTEENIIPVHSDSTTTVQARLQIKTDGTVNIYDCEGTTGLRFHGISFATI
jgi:hypothetical protein